MPFMHGAYLLIEANALTHALWVVLLVAEEGDVAGGPVNLVQIDVVGL